MKDGNNIEYVYAADGTRLKATRNTKLSAGRYSSRDRYYRGNLIFMRSNDKLPYTVFVPGGYYFYESSDEAFYLSLYVQDYQGYNRAELGTRPPYIAYTKAWNNIVGKTLNSWFSSGSMSKTTQTIVWTEKIVL